MPNGGGRLTIAILILKFRRNRVSQDAPGRKKLGKKAYEERESLLEFGDLFLGQRVGLWMRVRLARQRPMNFVPLKTRQRGVEKREPRLLCSVEAKSMKLQWG